ncbi:MAG TPA: hypothetical protein VKT82_15295 [Ktedonobacterales bacterium]|nr:hypothetical protein [Ktedonobacterales bacterium]
MNQYPGGPTNEGSSYGGAYPNAGWTAPPAPRQKSSAKALLIVLGIILVLGLVGGGVAFYLLTRPNPLITVTSSYSADAANTPAGAIGTSFQVTGSQFSQNSAITFLLDGQPLADAPATQSDAHGGLKATLPVTDKWSVGNHTITARDASNYATRTGALVIIVNQGEAGTPGPKGAPTNSATFQLQVTVQSRDATTGAQQSPQQSTLAITGPDGKVCDPKNDTGQPITQTGSGIRVTYVTTCSGTYKGGTITYTETLVRESFLLTSDNVTCTATNVPVSIEQLEGSFTDAHTASGSYKADAVNFSCSNGQTTQADPATGTWTGTLAG